MSPDTDVTKEELLAKMDKALHQWALGDIKKVCFDGHAAIAAFILGACFIDAMAGFRYGVTKATCSKNTKGRFMNFIEEYLPKYDAKTLWENLRNSLVHAYAEGGTYAFTHENKDGRHFTKRIITALGSERTVLNVEDFIVDLEAAYNRFVKDVAQGGEVFSNAKERYDSMGLLGDYPSSPSQAAE